MVDIESWMQSLTGRLRDAFGERLLFVGLQGSYRRGEANEDSDIDVVVILDAVCTEDLKRYKGVLETMPEQEKSCGFVSGRREIEHWPKHELFQFVHDTRSYYGSLDGLAPPIGREDIVEAVRIGASGLYHLCGHSYLHGDMPAMKELYKGAFFVLLAAHWLRQGRYAGSKAELRPLLDGVEREILSIGMDWNTAGQEVVRDPERYCDRFMQWCAGLLEEAFGPAAAEDRGGC